MKSLILPSFLAALFLVGCQNAETGPWADFKKCAGPNCVKEALAVKDAFLLNPKGLLVQFHQTFEKGEDHTVGWLYILRDSVLLNPAAGTLEERTAMQQALVKAAKPFANDPKIGESAQTILSVVEELAILAETEGDGLELGEPITGTYAFDLGEGRGGGELWVRRLSLDEFQFKLTVVGPAPAHNQGLMSGTVKNFDQAAYAATYAINEYGGECELQFTWDNTGVRIKTLKGDPPTCGFGNGVTADGSYKRNSFADPFLGKKDAAAAAMLEGEWVSETDPKYVLSIQNSQYTEFYDGKMTVPTVTYSYFGQCPAGCGAKGKFPCIRVFGQDEVCQAVVKADGKSLELSQVGGTGNTNRFRKK